MKILFLDLETFGFDFNADKGFILCGSYKWKGEKKVHTITRSHPNKFTDTPEDDKDICRRLAEVIAEADVVFTWNGRSFDFRFLQTRMLKHRLGYLAPVSHEDGLLTARASLKMNRSLKNMGKFFKLAHQKDGVDIDVWMKAGAGHPDALGSVIRHCETDIKMTEEAYNLLGPLSKSHPRIVNDMTKCRFCGSGNLQSRGRIPALRHYRQRYHCHKCGAWSSSQPIKYTDKGAR